MNMSEASEDSGTHLPKITKDNKGQRSSQYRMKEPLQTGCDKSMQILSTEEISQFRNSLKQNMCVEMLQEGWHRAFAELFFVLDSDRTRREALPPRSSDERQTPLEDQQDKMETMKLYLIEAEQAERTGSCTMVCEQLLSLGRYFTVPEDQWISLYFLHKCTDREKEGGCSKAATEAHMCLAQLYLQQGELEEAERHADMCAQQAEDAGWLETADRPLRLQARSLLWKIYNNMADAPLDAGDYDKALALLHKGYAKATESQDKQIKGEAMYRLGLTYQSAGDHDTAKQYFNNYIQICKALQDARGLGMGYTAMSKSLQSQGKIDESIRCLQTLKNLTFSSSMPRILLDVCMCLGDIFYSRNQYEQAVKHYLQSYHLVTELRDTALLQKTQVLVGNARAHFMIRDYSAKILSTSHSALQQLVTWKETRQWQTPRAKPTDGTAAAKH